MRRIPVEARPNATRLVQCQGLVYNDIDGASGLAEQYWPDNRYYSFTTAEIELLELAGRQVFDMCCEAVDFLQDRSDIVRKMGVPAYAIDAIQQSWNREPPWGSVYGRFDVCFGGLDHPDPRLRIPKFYEFNADTPTSLVEAASVQWLWLEQTGHGNDQWNSISEKLIAAWKRNLTLIDDVLGYRAKVHFAVSKGDHHGEDTMNTVLLLDTCRQAGWQAEMIAIEDVGLGEDGRFYDAKDDHIDVIFKLYPWEFLAEDEFGEACFRDMLNVGQRDANGQRARGTIWIEAPYKMLWSNKAIFAVLWHLFEHDERSKWLLLTFFDDEAPASVADFARKPIFSREGADVALVANGQVIQHKETEEYGLWFVDGDPAGMGIREDKTPITTNTSVFVPHSISDGPVNYDVRPIPDLDEIEACIRIDSLHEADDESMALLDSIRTICG